MWIISKPAYLWRYGHSYLTVLMVVIIGFGIGIKLSDVYSTANNGTSIDQAEQNTLNAPEWTFGLPSEIELGSVLTTGEFSGIEFFDQKIKSFSLNEHRGELALIHFLPEKCNEQCETALQKIGSLSESNLSDVNIISILLEPTKSSYESKKALFLDAYENWRVATVSDESHERGSLETIKNRFGGMEPGSTEVLNWLGEHLFLFNRDGILVQQYRTDAIKESTLTNELMRLAELQI